MTRVVETKKAHNFINYSGFTRGNIKVISYEGNQKWKCLCSLCGKYFSKDSRLVKKLHDFSCCRECSYSPENYSPVKVQSLSNRGKRLHKNKKYKGTRNISGHQWCHILNHAKKRNIEVKITIEQAQAALDRQNFKCALSGEDIEFQPDRTDYHRKRESHSRYNTASLDRIDSSKGYTEDNIQWIHKDVQKMKWDLNMDRFKELCSKIHRECGS